jgi:hypothetical protein
MEKQMVRITWVGSHESVESKALLDKLSAVLVQEGFVTEIHHSDLDVFYGGGKGTLMAPRSDSRFFKKP